MPFIAPQKRTAALLDVDDTLLFGSKELNQSLLDALKKKGILDIFLFTDMNHHRLSIEDRLHLIARLQEQGLTVHGVITPPDLVWDQFTTENAQHFNDTYKGAFFGQEFEDYLAKAQQPYIQAIRQYSPEKIKYGISFAEAAKTHFAMKYESEDTPLPKNITLRSAFAKAFGDRLAALMQYAHTKALLLDVFCHHKPEWVGNIFIADDNRKVINSIQQYKEKNPSALPITVIHVPNKELPTEHYVEVLNKNIIFIKIDRHIEELESEFRLFKTSPAAKITALTDLKDRINKSVSNDIGGIINQWLTNDTLLQDKSCQPPKSANVEKIISQHRNIFLAETRKGVPTSTEQLIESLKKEFSTVANEPGTLVTGISQKRA